MIINDILVKSFATGDGSITIELNNFDDTLIDSEEITSIATKYVKSRWTHQKDWFFSSSYNNSVTLVLMVNANGDGSVNLSGRTYEVYTKHDRRENITIDELIVTHNGCIVKFSEVVNPILYYVNNKGMFNVN